MCVCEIEENIPGQEEKLFVPESSLSPSLFATRLLLKVPRSSVFKLAKVGPNTKPAAHLFLDLVTGCAGFTLLQDADGICIR